MTIKAFFGILAASTALAACSSGSGGGSGGNGSGNTSADKVLAADAGTAAKALADGTTLRASGRASSAWVRDFSGDTTTAALAADSSVQIRKNNQGGLDLITPDGTFTFTADDLSEDGYNFELPDGSAGISAWNGDSMADALDAEGEERWSLMFEYWYDYGDGDGDFSRNGFGVIGTETADAKLATLPTATYEGFTRIHLGPTENFDDWDTQTHRVRGDLALTADFGAGQVSGEIDNLEHREPNLVDPDRIWTPFDGSLTLETADIVGNGFEGAVTADAGFDAAIGTVGTDSSYSGTFFGPDAEEVGGGISLTGTAADLTNIPAGSAYVGYGGWQAWQQ